MGFGYNPDLIAYGERLDILNFYSWMKQLPAEWFVYDASGYYIVNRTPENKISSLGSKPTADQILSVLIDEQNRPKRQEIMRNCDLRSEYLQRAIKISGINAMYVDSRKVFRDCLDYRIALDESLEFVRRLQKDDPALVEKIMPNNANPAGMLYLPLEIAEALYFEKAFNVSGKFGPKTEEFFDEAILRLMTEQGTPYQSIRCPIGPRKSGYLRDENVILTSYLDWYVSEIFRSDPEYKEFVSQYIESFRENGESILDVVLRMKKKLETEL